MVDNNTVVVNIETFNKEENLSSLISTNSVQTNTTLLDEIIPLTPGNGHLLYVSYTAQLTEALQSCECYGYRL